MSHAMAIKILDAVRGGVDYPEHLITECLKITGDITE